MKQVKDEKNKDKALEQVLADIEKQFGAGAIMKLGSDEHTKIDVTSSGIIAVTNKRLVIARDRVVIGYFFDSITPDLFNDLKVRSGIIWGKVIIDTVSELVILSNISKSALPEIEEEVTSAMLELKDEN